MKEGPDFARIATLMGDPARATILTALMSGRALTATELAHEAGVTPPTASSHLAKLQDGGLLKQRKQGRHRYYTLSGDHVARTIEAMMGLAANHGHLRTRTGPRDQALRNARVCYNHLAGDMGVHMYRSLMQMGHIAAAADGLTLTDRGQAFAQQIGVSLENLKTSRAPMCRDCLDWSARRSHLAGKFGRALLTRFIDLGWATRTPGTRIIRFSQTGQSQFEALFGPLPLQDG